MKVPDRDLVMAEHPGSSCATWEEGNCFRREKDVSAFRRAAGHEKPSPGWDVETEGPCHRIAR